MSFQFYKLKVNRIDKPIKDATTVTFDVPSHLKPEFQYYSGQHLILKCWIDGEECRRSYSLNSCLVNDEPLQITVKRVEKGKVSNYINDELKVGDEIEIMPPQGRFYADVKTDDYKTFYLFAAGSGITPIISILKSVLYSTTHSLVRLFYGNANQDTIIFKEELERLELEFTNRLKIVHTLSSPKVWSVWKQWSGRKGRIDSKAVEWFIKNYPPVAQSTEYYICGPGAMNMSIRNTLMRLDVPKTLIHIEQFAGSLDNADLDIDAVENATLDISLNGQKHELTIPKGQTILETLKSAKVSVPYSCEGGICGTCIAKVTKGKTAMKSCMALEEKEITKGWILTCQALPLTEKIEIEFS